MKRNWYFILMCCWISMGHWSVQAQGYEPILSIDALLELSLEELMQVKVETVSKNVEDLYSAPGIISVISAKEIRRFGGDSLHDVLERATSIVMGGSILYPRNNAVMRGDQVNGLEDGRFKVRIIDIESV